MPILPAARRIDVLSAAGDCFARLGFAKTNMQLLADAAGMSRPGLYQYFANKGELFAAAAEQNFGLLSAEISAAAAGQGSVARRLVVMLDIVTGMYRPPTPGSYFHAELINEVFTRAGIVWIEFQESVIGELTRVLASAAAEGVADDRLRPGAAALFLSAKGLGVDAAGPGRPIVTTAQLVDVVVNGIVAPSRF